MTVINYGKRDLERLGGGDSSTSTTVSRDAPIVSQVQALSNGTTGPAGSFSTSQIIDAICEGPIEGWPTSSALKYVYLDGAPVESYEGQVSNSSLRFEFTNGTADQNPLSNYTLIGAVKAPAYQAEILDANDTINGGTAITQQVQIRDDTDGTYPIVEAVAFTFSFPEGIFRYKSSGGRDNTPVTLKIELSPKSIGGTYVVCIDDAWVQEITSDFEVTYIVEIPPGWSAPTDLQKYAEADRAEDTVNFKITKYNSEWDNERAHTKLYLKHYAIYTKNQFSFPHTAVAGVTIDSKNFDGSIPRRQYELKLLKVKVPSNYSIVTDPKTGEVIERNYVGQWNGTFTEGVWTDNPVWCFYDLVTNERYGLGKFIDPSFLNKWKLYEIAKYCDAVVADPRSTYPGTATPVPANSYTFSLRSTDVNNRTLGGVLSGQSSVGKEPRFTCNLLISSREEAYSVVQRLASLFRAIVFYHQGTVQLSQDRAGTPIHLYNNTNVIDGAFAYQSSSTKARHTVAIVKWLDPKDLYSEKLEYVEDYDGIARYGYREIEIDGFGCTSRGQARRIGRHILITEKFELETVSFKVGLEGAVVAPGNLIKIKDSNRQLERAGGRIVSATNNSITIDKAISIPTGATSITLWVQTPTALNETIDGTTINTYNPTVNSYLITSGAGSSNLTTLTLSETTFTTIPSVGNYWILSYAPSGNSENTSTYRVMSISENNSFEYEITAIENYSAKYDEIETFAPIPQYKPEPLNLYFAPPDEGSISSVSNGPNFDLTITWRSSRYVSGTKYKLEVLNNTELKVLMNGTTSTSFVYKDVSHGVYYFNVYVVNDINKQLSEPLVLGPFRTKQIMPENNFSSFSQTAFGIDSITHSWPENTFPKSDITYEIWKASTDNLRSLIHSGNITLINYQTNTLTVRGLGLPGFSSPDVVSPFFPYAEIPIVPYTKYSCITGTTNSLITLSSIEIPKVSIGDKVVNAVRGVTSNVVSISQTRTSGKWTTQVTIAPTVAGQTTNDIVYFYKGVVGSAYKETEPFGAIKQKTLKAQTNTNATNIYVATGQFLNIATGDIVVNRTRNKTSIITKVNNQQVTTANTTGQQSGDIIAFYQHNSREVRKLKKYKIDWLGSYHGGDSIKVLKYDDINYIPQKNKSIMINLTRGVCAEVISAEAKNGVLDISTWPSLVAQGLVDNDEVVFINKDEVFSSSRVTHIHPTAGIAAAGTTTTSVTITGFFTGAKVGDILVNATRNTSSVILTKNSNNTVTLVGSLLSDLAIVGQTVGDIIFYVAVQTSQDDFDYNHFPILTTTTGTGSTTVNITTNGFTGITNSYRYYNMNLNASSGLTTFDNNTIQLTSPITGQQSGQNCYVFLPGQVTSTVVTAPDGAFANTRPGDIFYNITRNDSSTIKDIVTLTGRQDKKVDKITLDAPIAGQTAGDSFKILQGFMNYKILNFIDPGGTADQKVELEGIANIDLGDEINIYHMNAEKVGTSNTTTFTDNGLTTATTYYYSMRAISTKFPYLSGTWQPSLISMDPATTLPLSADNYNASNDNNGFPIFPESVSPVAPYIDLPAGGINKDSTANIRLYWEWTGIPQSIDGFSVYFWSSNSEVDDTTIDADEDYTKATSGFSLPVNPRLKIATLTWTTTGDPIVVTVTTAERHNFYNGSKVKILNAKGTILGDPQGPLPQVNTDNADYVTIVVTGPKTFTFTVPPGALSTTPLLSYSTNSGRAVSCLYNYQIDNLTANYYYNAWVQPYRQVNTNVSENGIILGTIKKLF